MRTDIVQWVRYKSGEACLATFALVALFSCAAHLPLPPPNIQESNILEDYGESTARNLTEAYLNTATNCGTPTSPAFLCSGVTLRVTKTSPNYDPWDHSDFSRTTGAVSFSYLRADAKFPRMSWYGVNGLIFYPYLNAPAEKTQPEIVCFFPLDGDTFYRNAATQYGCRDSILPPRVFSDSIPCREQHITTAEQWVNHYRLENTYKTAHSCSFLVTKDLGTEAVQAFNEAIRVSKVIPTEAFQDHNELRIKTWPEGNPGVLPIQAFFYMDDGLGNARIDQRKYYDRTNGLVVPIIRMTLPGSASQNATFTYNAADQAVLPSDKKIKPGIPKAYNTEGDRLRMSDIFYDTHLYVEIPHYQGMHATDTIRVRWQGRVNHNSEIITVGDPPGERLIAIPRMEVIDNIGRTVVVGYSVKATGNGETVESERLSLNIDPQAVHPLTAPIYSASKVTVGYIGQTGYSVVVRWTGVANHDTEAQNVNAGQTNVFNIPAAWISENRGKTVFINYSILRNNGGEQRMFSEVLRVEVTPAGLVRVSPSTESSLAGSRT